MTWSVSQGPGTIGATSGLYTALQAGGTATVRASSGSISGTTSVTISLPATFGATVAFTVVSATRTGFQAGMTITNTGTTAIDGWTLGFRFAARIRSIWGASVRRHRGKQYVLVNAGNDGTLAPGQSVSFGFLGRPGGVPAAPSRYVLNGVAIPASHLALVAPGLRPSVRHLLRRTVR
jgi:hypothetical protein